MKIRFILLLLLSLLIDVNNQATCQTNPVGIAWAKNSVNGTIFRKNSVTSFQKTQFTAYYDSTGTVVIAKRQLGTNSWEVNKTQFTGNIQDAHNSISIAVDGNGTVHMAWDHHGHPLRYSKSIDSLGIEMDKKQGMVGNLEDVVTYPEFFRMPNGDLTFIYRDGWSGNANCVVNKYSVQDNTWYRLHNNLISGQSIRSAYWQSCVDVNGVIHVSWVWRESPDVSSNHDMCYAKSTDGGLTWENSKGDKYELPIKASTAEKICLIPQNSELINQTSIYATSDSRPYIATYWTDNITNKVQYQIIYLDANSNWQQKVFSNRNTTFSLSGGGTKKIPISRPQVLVKKLNEKPVVYMLFRDNERGGKASMNVCEDINADTLEIYTYDITDFSVGDWEPTYDIDLWKDSSRLDIYVQRMEQGDGETLSDLPAQPVYIWSVSDTLIPSDTIKIAPPILSSAQKTKTSSLEVDPQPATNYLYIANLERDVNIEIYNITGKKVLAQDTNGVVNISSLESGAYVLNIEESHSFKFLK